jgi:hypothetical protein
VRPGTLLATSPHSDRPDHDATQALLFQPFELAEGARATARVFAPDGQRQVRFEALREGQQLRLRVASGSPPAGARYALLLPGGRKVPWEKPEQELVVSL